MSRITAAIQHSSSPNFTSTGRHKSLAKFALPHASKKSRNQSGWLAGWLAGWLKNVSHSSSTNFTKTFAKFASQASKKDSKKSRTSSASCWLTNVSEVKSYNPRQATALIRRFLLVQLCATNGAKTRKLRNTTTVGDSTPNHVT